MMTRRTGLMAIFAVMGEMVRAQQLTTSAKLLPQADSLTISLGGTYGYKRFTVTNGTETVTFTADELMAALKAPQ